MPFIELNGLNYYFQISGSGSPLLFLHGFTGSSQNWTELLDFFSKQYQVLLIDLPGHGRTDSPSDPNRYSMDMVSRDLNALLQSLQLSAINLLGYSMGGRLALYFSRNYPALLNSLILESASPGLKTKSERMRRIKSDNKLASEILSEGIPHFVERWQHISLFKTQCHLGIELLNKLQTQRLKNSEIGLANSLRGMGTGKQPSLWNELENIHLPVLIMTGELDRKFSNIAGEMAASLPKAEVQIIADAGHNIHLENPKLFTAQVLNFLALVKESVRD